MASTKHMCQGLASNEERMQGSEAVGHNAKRVIPKERKGRVNKKMI